MNLPEISENGGTKKRVKELRRAGIEVPFKSAWLVFVKKTLSRFYDETTGMYPTLDRLPGLCRSVLVSIVFNRGTDVTGSRRREMRAIQTILTQANQVGPDKPRMQKVLTEVEGPDRVHETIVGPEFRSLQAPPGRGQPVAQGPGAVVPKRRPEWPCGLMSAPADLRLPC